MKRANFTKHRLQELAGIGRKLTTIRENTQFSFTFDYNTDDDDITYIQDVLDEAGVDAYAKADPPEQVLVRAFDAQGLAKAKAAVKGAGFTLNEAMTGTPAAASEVLSMLAHPDLTKNMEQLADMLDDAQYMVIKKLYDGLYNEVKKYE